MPYEDYEDDDFCRSCGDERPCDCDRQLERELIDGPDEERG